MAVVIRLQRLHHSADSGDIRKFFSGLKIPHGGVHIIGGEHADEAFIMFESDEDGRRAMNRSGGNIDGRAIELRLSSKSEMQRVLEKKTKKVETRQHKEAFSRGEIKETSPSYSQTTTVENQHQHHAKADNRSIQNAQADRVEPDMIAVILKGMPLYATEEEVCQFFKGLQVEDVIMKYKPNGMKSGIALAKFTTTEDATEGLKRDMQYIGSRYVRVYPVTKKDWQRAQALDRRHMKLMAQGAEMTSSYNNPKFRSPSPVYAQRYQQGHARSCSPVAQQVGGRSRSPLAYRSRSPSPSNKEFCVLLENLSYSAEKRDVKELFRAADLQDDQILFLLDYAGNRTRSLFVLFRRRQDYLDALTLHKKAFLNRCVYISSISKEKMISILDKLPQYSSQERPSTSERRKEMVSSQPETSEHMMEELPERYSRFQERLPPSQSDQYNSERVCIYVQNLPFDVRKVEIMDFFHGFGISEDDVILLGDNTGVGLGEALVIFQTEVQAQTAQSLDGQRFLGSELLIRCLERSQMREFGVDSAVRDPTPMERSSESDMKYSDFRVTSDNHIPLSDLQVRIPGGSGVDSSSPYGPLDQGNASLPNDHGNGTLHNRFTPPAQNYGPTILKLVNLPFQITLDEIYDFCYGYRVIPGSVTMQYKQNGSPNGSATVVFESRQEAIAAIDELSGRPIGKRKVQLLHLHQ